jgi:hypothetical protein
VITCPGLESVWLGVKVASVADGERFANSLISQGGTLAKLVGYLVIVGFFLLSISVIGASTSSDAASTDSSPEDSSYVRQVEQVDDRDGNNKMLDLSYDHVPDSSEKPDPREMSLMVAVFARHVDQSDNPNENLRMVVASYDNYVVSRYINTWDDPTYFGGKRFSTNKYAINESHNFFYQGNVYAGILYGYGNNAAINVKGLAPAVFPTVGVGYKTTSLEMGYIPTPSGGVFLSLFKYEF